MYRLPREIAKDVRSDWDLLDREAEFFLTAMEQLNQITDCYDADPGVKILAQFRWAARKWRGPVAGQIKSEIDVILKAY